MTQVSITKLLQTPIPRKILNNMKPIYITDLDHTFLRTDQTVSDFSVKVWNEKRKDAILSIATARSFQQSHDFLAKLHLAATMILLDGTMIVTP